MFILQSNETPTHLETKKIHINVEVKNNMNFENSSHIYFQ